MANIITSAWGFVRNRIRFLHPLIVQNLAVLIFIIALLVLANYYWFFPLLERAEEQNVLLQRSAALRAQELLLLFLDLTFEDLADFGNRLNDNQADYQETANRIFESRRDVLNLLVADASGQVLFPTLKRDGTTSLFPASVTEAIFFKEAALSGKKYISPVFFTPQGPALQISVPISKGGKVVGVIASDIDFTLLWGIVSRISVQSGKIYLVDERGTLIAHPDTARSRGGENLRYLNVVEALVRGNKEVTQSRYVNDEKKPVIAYGLSMPSTNWGIVVEQEEAEALEQRSQAFLVASAFSGVSLILIIMLVISTVRLIRALLGIQREREERDKVIAYLPDGIIEYTGENKILTMNPAAKKYLNITVPIPDELYVTESSVFLPGFERLWGIFSPPFAAREGGQGNIFEITFQTPERIVLQIITVYIKGTGALADQHYLKIIHDITKERPP